ncbi:MAG: DUF3604 domain-containing protein [Proteobacteria bacterium]|nr:DUF3604 domain-containing protein [Pseudomonadota bacterium]
MSRHRLGRALLATLFGLAAGCGPGESWDNPIEGAAKPDSEVRRLGEAQREAHAGLEPRSPAAAPTGPDKTILFGDLHVHTSYSWDAFIMSLPLFGGEGAHPPADACDFARYCSNLDFFALTDHAEALRPEHWEASKQSVRECNARAGDPAEPDLVAFMGFEWTQAGLTPEDHWGHRCLFFPGTGDDELPARPIASANRAPGYLAMQGMLRRVRWLQPQHWGTYSFTLDHLEALGAREECAEGVPSTELPPDCLEIAETPGELHAKLDEWGLDVLDIPHGTAWGVYTPVSTTIDKHLEAEQFDPEKQRLIEIMSGHGNSEEYRDWRHFTLGADGERICPEPTPDFLPCCWQAGEIIRSRCGDLPPDECEARVAEARRLAMQTWTRPTQVVPDAAAEEWLDCGQCRDCAKPSYAHRPLESVQYAMSLSEPTAGGEPRRFNYGFIGSSDVHDARAGVGYKQSDLTLMTDTGSRPALLSWMERLNRTEMEDPTRAVPPSDRTTGLTGNDPRVQSYLYAGGLAAVHSAGRSRERIWDALHRREVYGTSGPRILLWFDLLNAPGGAAPMGSEHRLPHNPMFEVRAVGSFEPRPGCPDWAERGLSADRLEWLCRGECYSPGEKRRRIEAIEVVRIRPRSGPGEAPGDLIEDPWLRHSCPDDAAGCVLRFDDPEFLDSERDALYYARAIEEPSLALNGTPLNPRRDARGEVVSIELCESDPDNPDCLGRVRERAWSSPIFVNRAAP